MTPVLSSLLDASIRISLVAVLVTALVYGFRVRSSSLRHKAWLSVLAAMLLMPVLSRVAPRIAIPIAAPGVSEVSEGISPELHLEATTAAIGGSGGAAETVSKGLPAPVPATSITPAAPAGRAFPWSALFAALYDRRRASAGTTVRGMARGAADSGREPRCRGSRGQPL